MSVLERFKAQHEQIEASIRQTSFEDVDYVYGADIPARLQPAQFLDQVVAVRRCRVPEQQRQHAPAVHRQRLRVGVGPLQ